MRHRHLTINNLFTIGFSIIFLLILFVIGTLNIYNESPFFQKLVSEMDGKSAKSCISLVDKEYTNRFYLKSDWINLYGGIQRMMLKHEVGNFDVIKDNQGWLHMPVTAANKKTLKAHADNLSALYTYIKAKEIPFLYVQAPCDIITNQTTFPIGYKNTVNEDLNQFLTYVKAKNIPYLDTRVLLKDFNQEDLFYKTDHHWALPAAFASFGSIINRLHEQYALELDPEMVYQDLTNYDVKKYPNCFLGSHGVRVGSLYAGKDDFKFYLPKQSGSFTNTYYVKHKKQWEKSGSFRTAFIDDKLLQNEKYNNKYNVFMYGSMCENRIINHLANTTKKCLVISDSFGRQLVPYLSQCFQETRWLDPQAERYTDSYTKYIDEFDPDCVIVMFNGNAKYVTIPL